MKKIQNYVEQMDDELKSARDYAETALQYKAEGNQNRSSKYKEMANQELAHANNIHQIAVEDIQKLEAVYTPPVEMKEKWDKAHSKYVEDAAWIKHMLTL